MHEIPTTNIGWKQPAALMAYKPDHPLNAKWLTWIKHPKVHQSDYCSCSKTKKKKKGVAVGCGNCGTCPNCHKQVDGRIFDQHVQACSGIQY